MADFGRVGSLLAPDSTLQNLANMDPWPLSSLTRQLVDSLTPFLTFKFSKKVIFPFFHSNFEFIRLVSLKAKALLYSFEILILIRSSLERSWRGCH